MKTSETVGELNKAKAAFQAEMPTVKKTGLNPHFGSQFADIGDILGTALPIAGKHGLSLSQHPEGGPEYPVLTSRLSCAEEWEESSMPLFVSKSDAQGFGSALTYARRYAACAILGIATEDDDGNAASEPVHRTSGVVQGSYTDKQNSPITDAQLRFLAKLTNGTIEEATAAYSGLTTAKASALIDELKEAG